MSWTAQRNRGLPAKGAEHMQEIPGVQNVVPALHVRKSVKQT